MMLLLYQPWKNTYHCRHFFQVFLQKRPFWGLYTSCHTMEQKIPEVDIPSKEELMESVESLENDTDINTDINSEKVKNKNIERISKKFSLSDGAKTSLYCHPKLSRATRQPEGMYLLEKFTSDAVVKLLYPVLKDSSMLFEINPGPGVLTEAFLKHGIKKLRVFEENSDYIPYLEALKQKFSDQMEIVNDDFLSLASIMWQDMFRENSVADSFFKDSLATVWTDPPVIQIFSILPSSRERRFMSYMTKAIETFQHPFAFGRAELLLFVSGKEYAYLTATPHEPYNIYRSSSVLNQTFFDIDLLHVEPRSSFFPPKPTSETSGSSFDDDKLYLMKMTPKAFLFDLLPPTLIGDYCFFISHHLTKRKGFIIPTLEQWMPGIGLHLIKWGIHVHAQFGELTSAQLLTLFLQFSSLPDYSVCLFRAAAKACNKHKHNADEDEDEDEEDEDEDEETED